MPIRGSGVTCDRGRYYYVKRVPREFAGIVKGKDGKPVSQVRVALRTDSLTEANRKAKQVEAELLAEWESLALGDKAAAHKHYEAARKLAAARGFSYRPIDSFTPADIDELVKRVEALQRQGQLDTPEAVTAILGGARPSTPTLAEVFEEWKNLTRTGRSGQSAAQARRWERARRYAIETFDQVMREDPRFPDEPLPVGEIARAHALAYREWWAGRIEADGLTASAANRNIGLLSRIIREWSELKGSDLDNPFKGLRLKGAEGRKVPPFSEEWIRDKLLAPGAFAALNDEAADVLLMMVNTGLRPSEITDAPPSDFEVDAPVPFFRVAPNGRELKITHTRRDVPLLGVSLTAARRIARRGGIQRYAHKAASWSAAVSKHLRTHGLRETDAHTPYSLRHSIEDRLLDAGIDERIRADILGHKYSRPRYGQGGAMEGRRAALALVAFEAPE